MLIDATYFVGEILVANASTQAVAPNLTVFINKYETKFLKQLLGDALYAEFTSGLGEDPIPPKWQELKNLLVDTAAKTSPIANYIYYWYQRDQVVKTVGVGQAKPAAENATITTGGEKFTRAWNEMVDFTRCFTLDAGTYPTWVNSFKWTWSRLRGWSYPDIYSPINSLNI